MFRRFQQLRRSSAARFGMILGVAVLLVGSIGCGGERPPRDGGATTHKAKENRKVAEQAALESVQAGAREQVAHHPEMKRKSTFVRAEEKVKDLLGFEPAVSVSVNVPPSPPKPPSPPSPKSPVLVAPATTRPESSVRAPARNASPVVISERIITEIPYPTEAEAETRVLEDAQKMIEKRLRELDPPVEYLPPVPVVRNEYLRRDSRLVRLPTESERNAIAQAGYASDRKYVEYTVEITADQVRELRTRNRVADGLRGLGMITAVSLAGFLFLRLDEWSKGYLTSWLALAAAGLGGGIVAAMLLV